MSYNDEVFFRWYFRCLLKKDLFSTFHHPSTIETNSLKFLPTVQFLSGVRGKKMVNVVVSKRDSTSSTNKLCSHNFLSQDCSLLMQEFN